MFVHFTIQPQKYITQYLLFLDLPFGVSSIQYGNIPRPNQLLQYIIQIQSHKKPFIECY